MVAVSGEVVVAKPMRSVSWSLRLRLRDSYRDGWSAGLVVGGDVVDSVYVVEALAGGVGDTLLSFSSGFVSMARRSFMGSWVTTDLNRS